MVIDSLGFPYDYFGMMHYSEGTLGYGKTTIKKKDPFYQNVIGNGGGFSKGDIDQINAAYNCKK